jgi:hypothetical protein
VYFFTNNFLFFYLYLPLFAFICLYLPLAAFIGTAPGGDLAGISARPALPLLPCQPQPVAALCERRKSLVRASPAAPARLAGGDIDGACVPHA